MEWQYKSLPIHGRECCCRHPSRQRLRIWEGHRKQVPIHAVVYLRSDAGGGHVEVSEGGRSSRIYMCQP